MELQNAKDSEARFAAYVERLASMIGHADREGPLRDYCAGLMLPGQRKSVEPMAALTAPARMRAQHQSLLHFVGEGRWLDEKVLAKVRDIVLPEMERHGPIEAWILDDTGFPKKGRHSVGVARQYCGAARQTKQLSSRSLAVAGQPSRQPACGLSPVSAERLGDRQETPTQGRRSRRHQIQNQAADRARASALGVCGWPSVWCGPDGRRLWRQRQAADEHDDAGLDLRRRHSIEHHGVGAGHSAAGAKDVFGPWAAAQAHAPRWQPSTALGQEAGPRPAQARLGSTITWREGTDGQLSARFARVPCSCAQS